jgi:FHA domain-containing protein
MAGDTAIWQVPAPAPAMRPASRPPPRPEPSLAPDPALWQAFCDAAGVQVDLPQGLGPAEMRTLGQLLRAAVDGTMLLLAGRTLQQPAPGSDLTSTQAADNNPLDFAASGQDALELLLQPPLRGFMAAPDAMTRTMQQLVSHQTGQSAAWHAAVDGAFDPFAPAELQARHRPAMVIHTLLPMTHRSRLWSHYLADFDTLCHQARDRLQARYEQAYVAACYPGAERRPATDRPTNQGSVPPPHHDVSHPPPPSGRSAPAGDRTP